MRGRLAVAIPSAVRPLPMHQSLRQAIALLVRETEPRDRIERVALLRPAPAIASLDYRNPFHASMFRHRALRLELHVEGAVEPPIEHLLTHREQRLVALRITNLREHRQRPMRSAPLRVYMRLAHEPLVPSGNQRPCARRRPDFFPQLPNFPRPRIFSLDARHHLPPNRRFVALQERIDDSSSIHFMTTRHSANSESFR